MKYKITTYLIILYYILIIYILEHSLVKHLFKNKYNLLVKIRRKLFVFTFLYIFRSKLGSYVDEFV